jgi:hypothetical protein
MTSESLAGPDSGQSAQFERVAEAPKPIIHFSVCCLLPRARLLHCSFMIRLYKVRARKEQQQRRSLSSRGLIPSKSASRNCRSVQLCPGLQSHH